MTSMTLPDEVLKTDVLARVRVKKARRNALLDEFERGGTSAQAFEDGGHQVPDVRLVGAEAPPGAPAAPGGGQGAAVRASDSGSVAAGGSSQASERDLENIDVINAHQTMLERLGHYRRQNRADLPLDLCAVILIGMICEVSHGSRPW